MSCMLLCACPHEEDDDLVSSCDLNSIIVIEEQFTNQASGVKGNWGHTYVAIKASNNKISVTIKEGITVIVENYAVVIGTQQLNSMPNGKVIFGGLTYTTYYQTNGQTPSASNPNGTLKVASYNKDCNTISGSIEMQPWAFHDDGSGTG